MRTVRREMDAKRSLAASAEFPQRVTTSARALRSERLAMRRFQTRLHVRKTNVFRTTRFGPPGDQPSGFGMFQKYVRKCSARNTRLNHYLNMLIGYARVSAGVPLSPVRPPFVSHFTLARVPATHSAPPLHLSRRFHRITLGGLLAFATARRQGITPSSNVPRLACRPPLAGLLEVANRSRGCSGYGRSFLRLRRTPSASDRASSSPSQHSS